MSLRYIAMLFLCMKLKEYMGDVSRVKILCLWASHGLSHVTVL